MSPNASTLLSLLLLASFAARPSLARSSDITRCAHNLKSIEIAKEIIAQDNGFKPGDEVEYSQIEKEYPGILRCRSGGTYIINPIGTAPTCSIPTHTMQEAPREIAHWKKENNIRTAIALTTSAVIISAPIVGINLFVKWRKRKKPAEMHST
ncbi:MAG TPA: hypothetical protein VM680_00705 [Verrucomicrobiae bacterium]|nr:hypothetical protein [Verrucomicrobiae bacterium]